MMKTAVLGGPEQQDQAKRNKEEQCPMAGTEGMSEVETSNLRSDKHLVQEIKGICSKNHDSFHSMSR